MAAHSSDDHDQALLDRLNALKPSSVRLEPPDPLDPLRQRDDPPATSVLDSRDDALTARLKILREGNAASTTPAPAPRPEDPSSWSHPDDRPGNAAKTLTPCQLQAQPSADPTSSAADQPLDEDADQDDENGDLPDRPAARGGARTAAEGTKGGERHAIGNHDQRPPVTATSRTGSLPHREPLPEPNDPFALSDDPQAIDDLLDELAGGDAGWLVHATTDADPGHPAQHTNPNPTDVPREDEHRRVAALLAQIEGESNLRAPQHGRGAVPGDHGGDTDSDDSDGDTMRRRVNEAMAEAADEADLERSRRHAWRTAQKGPTQHHGADDDDDKNDDSDDASYRPSLPKSADKSYNNNTNTNTNNNNDPLSFPSVPTDTNTTDGPSTDALEKSLALRMAALKVDPRPTAAPSFSSPSSPDPFASLLPSAPSFDPTTPSTTARLRPSARPDGKPAYTDADQATWCVACLDDAAVSCDGCDGDVYCERCWRDMHRGPAAGFDERSHVSRRFEGGGRGRGHGHDEPLIPGGA